MSNTEEMDIIPFPLLTKEVGIWSHYNFGTLQNPWLGMVEEVGELAHCLLKRSQCIRGFDDPSYFSVQFMDALGDIGIYAANYAYNEGMRDIEYPKARADLTAMKHMANALFWLSELRLMGETADDYKGWLRKFLKEVSNMAMLERFDFAAVTTDTWRRVKQRNWKKNTHDGQATHEKNVGMVNEEAGEEETTIT